MNDYPYHYVPYKNHLYLNNHTLEGVQTLLEFRIPYYVGPLNDTTSNRDIKNENAWLIRKNNAAITFCTSF